MIYLDYAATTPPTEEVVAAMQSASWANPASAHALGQAAAEQVAAARHTIASVIGADAREVTFTSGATEANNLALQGAASFYADRGRHIVTVQTEHKAVLDTCAWLEGRGFEITYLSVDDAGLIDLGELQASLRDDTILVSVMQVNNETGVMQPLAAIAECVQNHATAKLHVDAAQGFAKLPLDWQTLPIDYLSASAHKCYGPKGTGVLFTRRLPRARLQVIQHGGGHEAGLRSGTLSAALCVGFAAACEQAITKQANEIDRMQQLKAQFWQQLQTLGGVVLHGGLTDTSPFICNVGFAGVMGESLLLDLSELAVSSGSACASANREPSAVLRAMGVSEQLAESSLRFSFGWQTTEQDIQSAASQTIQSVQRLRAIAGELYDY